MSYILSRNAPAVPADTSRLHPAFARLRSLSTINYSMMWYARGYHIKRFGKARFITQHTKVAMQIRAHWHKRYKPHLYTRRLA